MDEQDNSMGGAPMGDGMQDGDEEETTEAAPEMGSEGEEGDEGFM